VPSHRPPRGLPHGQPWAELDEVGCGGVEGRPRPSARSGCARSTGWHSTDERAGGAEDILGRLPAGPDTGVVHHVYLDQNKWIDLAKARSGRKEGAHLVEVLQAAQEAVRAGDASFPLSAQHYYETLHRGGRESREHLAGTMLGLSQGDAIAPAKVVVPYEIEIALIEQLQLPNDRPPAVQIFGKGANHVFNTEMFTYEAPDEYEGCPLPAELQAMATVVGSTRMEFAILAGSPSSETTRLALSEHMRLTGSEFACGQQDLRDRIAEMRSGRRDDAMTATAIADILDLLLAACTRLGVDPGRLLAGGSEVLGPLVYAIPSRWVEREMRRLRHANRQKQWEGNDLNDVMALSVAVPYCDVVVTEGQWVHFVRAAKLDRRCKTKMISDLRRLPELLGR